VNFYSGRPLILIRPAGVKEEDERDEREAKSGTGKEVSISDLVDHWQDYDVYVSTLNGARLFAFKGPETHITVSDHWARVNNKSHLGGIVNDIETQPPMGQYFPRLWKVVGPGDRLYGYLLTAWTHVVMTKVNENTLFVQNLPAPPYISTGGMISGD
jgi:hypothetical protein